jgi:hypothetical protein
MPQVPEVFTKDSFKSIYFPTIIKSRLTTSDGFFINFVTVSVNCYYLYSVFNRLIR